MALEASLPNSDTTTGAPQMPEHVIGKHGLRKKIVRRGTTWQTPCPGDEVEVHYNGHVEDGSSLGSTHDSGATFKFKLNQREVIEGLDEGVATMKKGEIAIFRVPAHLAYGDAGYPPLVPPNSTLIFDVEMISWNTIRDITGDGGVLKKVINEGEGWATPKDGDHVSVKYEARLENDARVSVSERTVEFHVGHGKLCPAIHEAVKTMRKNEKAELSVKFCYGFGLQDGSEADERNGCFSANPNITISLELLSWRSVVDVLGDKTILKKIISAGEGLDQPNEGSMAKVIYDCSREDGAIFEHKGSYEEPFEYMCLEDQISEGLDRAIMSMKKGEKAQVFIRSNVQGNGVFETVSNDPRLVYQVELLDFTKEKPFWKMEAREKIEVCDKKKRDGNSLFKAGKFWLASKKYEKGAKCIEFNHKFSDEEKRQANELLLSCNLNNAACKLKLDDFVGAVKLCTKVLERDPNNAKALYRRSQAYLNTSDLEKAEADIRRALSIDPKNRDIKIELKVIKAKQKEHALHQAKLYSTMISKFA